MMFTTLAMDAAVTGSSPVTMIVWWLLLCKCCTNTGNSGDGKQGGLLEGQHTPTSTWITEAESSLSGVDTTRKPAKHSPDSASCRVTAPMSTSPDGNALYANASTR